MSQDYPANDSEFSVVRGGKAHLVRSGRSALIARGLRYLDTCEVEPTLRFPSNESFGHVHELDLAHPDNWLYGDSCDAQGDISDDFLSYYPVVFVDAGRPDLSVLKDQGRDCIRGLGLPPDCVFSEQLQNIEHLGGLIALEVSGEFNDMDLTAAADRFPSLRYLSLDASRLSDASFSELARFGHLEILRIVGALGDRHMPSISKIGNLRSLVMLGRADQPRLTNDGARYLRGLPNLSYLIIRNHLLNDAGLEALEALNRLDHLVLTDMMINGEGLAALRSLDELKWLVLDRNPISDSGLEALPALPGLRQLDMRGTQLTDRGLESLNALPVGLLTYLHLDSNRITGEGFRSLREPLSLCGLDLRKTDVSDRGLEFIARHHANGLYLDQTLISDDGIQHLMKMKTALGFSLTGTRVTPSAARALMRAVNCWVDINGRRFAPEEGVYKQQPPRFFEQPPLDGLPF